MFKSKKKLFNYIVFILLAVVLLVPKSRIWVQQGLMKLGMFKPNLEQPAELEAKGLNASFISHKDGSSVEISDLKGKVVFINFWATWCPPCLAEMPSIQLLYNKMESNPDVVFLMVEIDSAKEKTISFLEKNSLDLPVYYPTSQIPKSWLGGSIPTTIILDKEGEIAAKQEGMADFSKPEVYDFLIELTAI